MGGGGGAWKVAYADFVTAMMAFFMVMWLTAQSEEVKEAIGGYFQDPWGTTQESSTPTMMSPSGISGSAPFGDASSGMLPNRWPQSNQANATEKEAGAASVWQQPQKIYIINNNDRSVPALVVQFANGTAELDKVAKQRLNDLMPAIQGKQNRIELRAHSTRRPVAANGPYSGDHWKLCYARSAEVMNFLLRNKIEPERVRLSQAAAFDPLTNDLEASMQNENDCVEVFLLTETSIKAPGTTPTRKSETNQPAAVHAKK